MKKSYLHAIAAFAYIAVLVTFMSSNRIEDGNPTLTGITMLSLFVFSAALMGYLFLSKPILLYLEGKKEDAVKFFTETLITFGIFALSALLISVIIQ